MGQREGQRSLAAALGLTILASSPLLLTEGTSVTPELADLAGEGEPLTVSHHLCLFLCLLPWDLEGK